MSSIVKAKKTKLFWVYFVVALFVILGGVVLLPVWDNTDVFWKSWGSQIINIIIGACIIVYLLTFLLRKILTRQKGVIMILTIVEFVVLSLVALGCILQQFQVINVGGACQILGLALWCRGVVECFRAYFHQSGDKDKYPLYFLVIALAFVSFGTYMFAKPIFSDVEVLWVVSILIILVGLLLVTLGIMAKPNSKK